MNTSILRLLWSLISEISPDEVSGLSNDALVRNLTGQLNARVCLSLEEHSAIKSYLTAKQPLIRDILEGQSMLSMSLSV